MSDRRIITNPYYINIIIYKPGITIPKTTVLLNSTRGIDSWKKKQNNLLSFIFRKSEYLTIIIS